ncbi:hypothetical protein G7046_g9503 [Stylonectria norvegica]|nr:hypothetical protein G7046_g9503 [Stylonectria norvegica]
MLSLKTLLNPAPAGPEHSTSFRPSPTLSSPAFSFTPEISTSSMDRSMIPRLRTPKEPKNMAKSKLRGPIKYPPFENLDNASLVEIRRFQVQHFGHIHQSCLHIPYNSGKKDFYEKTGRESFEVFRYEFRAPGNDAEFAVMWDYNVGLVRMTPFFKCCQYGKTMPAKMLSLNPGLKDITHSITGGSIAAQGYWMPYRCARAVCATFCFHIAGALIPIFGPSFPADCIHPDSPDFARMVINPQFVMEATREAEIAKRLYSNNVAATFNGATSFPRYDRPATSSPYVPEERTVRPRPRLVCDPAWLSDGDVEGHHSAPNSASSTGSGLHGYMITSRPGSSWASTGPPGPPIPPHESYHHPSPWLSAVPRIAPIHPQHTFPGASWGSKRRFDYEDEEYMHEGSASPNISMGSAVMTASPEASPARDHIRAEVPSHDPAQKSAAMLLLNLSMPEHGQSSGDMSSPSFASIGVASPGSSVGEVHRKKRQRATSF